jgi:hypothetical protein
MDMAEEKTERKPEPGKGGLGQKKDDAGGAEVAGRSRKLIYTCFNDGAGNYIDPDWKWFTCWYCGMTYYL